MSDCLIIETSELSQWMIHGSPLWLWIALRLDKAVAITHPTPSTVQLCNRLGVQLVSAHDARAIQPQDIRQAFNLPELNDNNECWSLVTIVRMLLHGMPLANPLRAFAERIRRAHPVSNLIVDCDGVLTNGSLQVDEIGAHRSFHVLDGQGVVNLQQAGGAFAIITGSEPHPSLFQRAQMLSIHPDNIRCSVTDKAAAFRELCQQWGIEQWTCAYVGDDISDISAFDEAAQSFAPENAHAEAKRFAMETLSTSGGSGAVREICDRLCRVLL